MKYLVLSLLIAFCFAKTVYFEPKRPEDYELTDLIMSLQGFEYLQATMRNIRNSDWKSTYASRMNGFLNYEDRDELIYNFPYMGYQAFYDLYYDVPDGARDALANELVKFCDLSKQHKDYFRSNVIDFLFDGRSSNGDKPKGDQEGKTSDSKRDSTLPEKIWRTGTMVYDGMAHDKVTAITMMANEQPSNEANASIYHDVIVVWQQFDHALPAILWYAIYKAEALEGARFTGWHGHCKTPNGNSSFPGEKDLETLWDMVDSMATQLVADLILIPIILPF